LIARSSQKFAINVEAKGEVAEGEDIDEDRKEEESETDQEVEASGNKKTAQSGRRKLQSALI